MRLKSFLLAVLGLLSVSFAPPQPASAFDLDRPDQPAGWHHMRTIRHWVYHPNYRHIYLHRSETDPYTYRYVPRGYYPYYNAMYWQPATVRRHNTESAPYYASWGSKRRKYHHVEWHRRHYGGHRRGNW